MIHLTRLNPFWGENYYVPIFKSQISAPESDSSSSVPADGLSLCIFDYNNLGNDKFMGGTGRLSLSKWVQLLTTDKRPQYTAAESPLLSRRVSTSPQPMDGSESRPASPILAPLTSSVNLKIRGAERERMISDWGSPFNDSRYVSVFCPLFFIYHLNQNQ